MNPRTTGPRRFAHFARSARMFALGLPVTLALLQGCAASSSLPTGSTSSSGAGEAGAGGSGQTGGMGGMGGSSVSSSSSSSSASSSSGMGGAGAGFMPPAGTADYPAETEVNDVAALANSFVPSTKGFTGSIFPIGDIDVFEVDITMPGTKLTVSLSDGKGGCPAGLSATLRVDGPNGLLGADGGACPKLSHPTTPSVANLPAGKHYVQIESASFSFDPFYVVEIALEAPICGNGILQGPEQCDDGNMNAGDGCAANCTFEGNAINEVEPNQPETNANSVDGTEGAFASITPVGDVDYFSFTLPAGMKPVIETHNVNSASVCTFDTEIALLNSMGTVIATDDESGVDACSLINGTLYPAVNNLPAGTYYVRVNEFMSDAAITSYQLDVKFQ